MIRLALIDGHLCTAFAIALWLIPVNLNVWRRTPERRLLINVAIKLAIKLASKLAIKVRHSLWWHQARTEMLAKEQQTVQLPVPHLRIWLDGSSVLIYCTRRGTLISCGAAVLAALAARCDGLNWPVIVEELEQEMGISAADASLALEQARNLYEPNRELFAKASVRVDAEQALADGRRLLRIIAPDRSCQLSIDIEEESARLPIQRLLSPLLSAGLLGDSRSSKLRSVRWQLSRSQQGWTLSGEQLHPVSGLAMQQLGPVLIDQLKHWLLEHSSACLLMQGDALNWQQRLWLIPATAKDAKQRALSAQLMQSGAVHLSQQEIAMSADWSALDYLLPVQVEACDWRRMPPERWLDGRSWRGLDGRELRYYFCSRGSLAQTPRETVLLRSSHAMSSLCEAGTIGDWCRDLQAMPFQPLSSGGAFVDSAPLSRLVPWLADCQSLCLPECDIDQAAQQLIQWLGFDRDRRQILSSARDHLSVLES